MSSSVRFTVFRVWVLLVFSCSRPPWRNQFISPILRGIIYYQSLSYSDSASGPQMRMPCSGYLEQTVLLDKSAGLVVKVSPVNLNRTPREWIAREDVLNPVAVTREAPLPHFRTRCCRVISDFHNLSCYLNILFHYIVMVTSSHSVKILYIS